MKEMNIKLHNCIILQSTNIDATTGKSYPNNGITYQQEMK